MCSGFQGGDTGVRGLGSFEDRFPVTGCNTRRLTHDFMGLPPRPSGNRAPGPGAQPSSSCRPLSLVCPPLITVSILTGSCLFLEVIFLSLSLLVYFGICLTLWRHSKYLSVDSASAVPKQAEESCLLASPMDSGQGTQEFVLGLRPPETQVTACALVIAESWSQPSTMELLLPEHFLRSCFVPGTVLVVRDMDNSSRLLNIDCARHSLRAGAITSLIFIDKTESQRGELT